MNIYNKNFLNNQNYIFGKNEKKSILIKFFTEKITIFYFYTGINYFYKIIFIIFFLIIYLLFTWLFVFFINLFIDSVFGVELIAYIIFLSILFLLFNYLVFISGFGIFKNRKTKLVRNLKEFLKPPFNQTYISILSYDSYNFKSELNIYILFYLLGVFGIMYLLIYLWAEYVGEDGFMPMLFATIIIIPIFSYSINLFSLIILVLYVIFVMPFIILYNIVNVIFNGYSNYRIIKFKPIQNLINKLDFINPNEANNKFYLINKI